MGSTTPQQPQRFVVLLALLTVVGAATG